MTGTPGTPLTQLVRFGPVGGVVDTAATEDVRRRHLPTGRFRVVTRP